jgi:catechol 2,3-dioxygenase-like lactoylglutathione lyase family enzyme
MSQRPLLQVRRANTILYCQAWSATVAFYRERLGLVARFENDWFVEFRLCENACLSVADANRASIAAVAGQGITLTLQIEGLAEVHTCLKRAGVEVTSIRRRWGAWVFYCHDPEGHRIEFWAEQPPEPSPDCAP